MDQMVKATLASVGPNTIDVRNEAGDTLLILACQHGCEVWLIAKFGFNLFATEISSVCKVAMGTLVRLRKPVDVHRVPALCLREAVEQPTYC